MLKIWSELTSPQMRALPKENAIAAVVVGSCEQHARHLPLATDTILGEGVLKAAAMRSKNTVVLLPSIPYGFSHHHRSFAGTVSLPQSVLASVTEEVFRCAAASGFHRLLMLCSHGGNSAALHCALNELGAQHGIKVVFARYWDFAASYIASWRQSGMGGIGHAGEMETALMMHLRPELVDETQLEGYHPAKGNEWFHPDMFAPNKILMYNNFESYSPDGNVGEPAYATAARGEALADYIAAQLALFLDGFWEGNNYIGDDLHFGGIGMQSIHDNLKNYLGIIKAVAEQFGSHCEVVLHDLTKDYEHTIVAIENGYITGRSVGDCGSNLGLQVLSGNQSKNGLYRYYTRMPNGKLLKSSTCYLQDDTGNVIGAICINFDISGLISVADTLRDYDMTFTHDEKPVNEVFANNVNELLDALIDECDGIIGKNAEYMTKQDKIDAIKFLDSRGAFLITKSGDRICRYLEISKNTLYSYLDIARST